MTRAFFVYFVYLYTDAIFLHTEPDWANKRLFLVNGNYIQFRV